MTTNKHKLAIALAAGMLVAACPVVPSLASGGTVLEKVYSRAWKDAKSVDYVTPSADELAVMQQVFVRLLKGEPVKAMASDLQTLGWAVFTESVGGVTWTIVAEAENQRRGRGLYAFSNAGRHALEAPHVPSDELTGQILLRYAEDGLPRALAWNTVPRKTADLAHLDGTYLIAFSRAFAQVYPSEKILQLHGFDAQRRRSAAGAESGAIISAARNNPPPELKSAVKCMQQEIEKRTRLYGVDVHELGAMTNNVARALRNEGYQGFIHVEMDSSLREQLVDVPAKRQALLNCLGGTT